MADCRVNLDSYFFITPSRKQNIFVNLPVGDSSPSVLIPGQNFFEEMMFSLRPNQRQRHWGKGDGRVGWGGLSRHSK